jgi:hypothetical protein
MITGGNWWRAKEIVIGHLTHQTDARYHSRDSTRATLEQQRVALRSSGLSPAPGGILFSDALAAGGTIVLTKAGLGHGTVRAPVHLLSRWLGEFGGTVRVNERGMFEKSWWITFRIR